MKAKKKLTKKKRYWIAVFRTTKKYGTIYRWAILRESKEEIDEIGCNEYRKHIKTISFTL